MKARQFWYPLPERLIAQHPAERRGTERMMVLHRDTGVIEHRHIADIVEYLTPNDLLVYSRICCTSSWRLSSGTSDGA